MTNFAKMVIRLLAFVTGFAAVSKAIAGTGCNPTTTKNCPPMPGLNTGYYEIDFSNDAKDASKYWTTSAGAQVTRDSRGMALQYLKRFDAPQLVSTWYMWYGRVDVQLQVAKGQGVVTSIVLMSDTLDEIDWEWSGNNFGYGPSKGRVQTNYFGKGVTGTYDRGTTVDVENPQATAYTYTLVWRPDSIEWRIDGRMVRTFYAKDAETKPGSSHQFPQTPAKLQIGIWAGGDPSNPAGVIEWAGGVTDANGGPYVAYINKITVQNQYAAAAYNWTDQSGSHGSVRQLSQDPGNLVPVSPALLPLRSELPVTQIGRCGRELNTICKGSVFGDCCSQYNTCGSTAEYCGSGCQGAYGKCAKPNIFANEKLEFEPEPTTSVKRITSTSSSTTLSTSTSQSTKASTSTLTAPLRTDLPPTANGHCGPKVNTICKGSVFGDCCSEHNYCGNGPDYCGAGCQSAFGRCGDAPVEPKAATTFSSSQSPKVATSPVGSPSVSASTSASTSTTMTKPPTSSTAAAISSTPVANAKLAVSQDGSCGGKDAKFTCTGGVFGECCSQYNFCGNSIDHCSTGCQVGFGRCDGSPVASAASSQRPDDPAAILPTSSPTSRSSSTTTTKTATAATIGYTCDDDFWWENNYCYKYMGANGQMKKMTSAFCNSWSGKMSDVPNWLNKDCGGDIERIRGACCGRYVAPPDATSSKLARRRDDAAAVGGSKGPSPWASVVEYLTRKQAKAADQEADRRAEKAAT
ncbi:hypothetical protein PpBr36_04799 [Pyricularia pennisetigena]|uniref:hypothetical protein n=1 Tax=Pyricularia pennisetigena TaxID=1578925 RepID=UPI001154D7FD|nr:hypothetical protein PpBr36_04799 [Pyricularia pennisetigena]TLS26866.1 hypothetical protein PpBr36_04799 [Pyricularia pennisetigena]